MSIYTTIVRLVAIFALTLFACGQASAQENKDQPISFNRDIRPILSDRCYHCHGPDAENQESAFRLDTREHVLEDLGGYAGIVPGDLENSTLHQRIRSDDEGEQMPPVDSVRQLTEKEKDILDAWIMAGAPFDDHWSFTPIADEIAVPKTDSRWPRNDIDRFIFYSLKQNKIDVNQEASREKWLRRVTFDLTGLPPTIAEIESFKSDQSDSAYEKVVDRLLQSDACAERLTSEWLDVARYSDSYGYQRDDERYVWPYRDWVISAFKNNMPYDQFVTWQLAGDLMEDPTREQIVATAFNRLHSHKKEGGVALEEFRMENVADRTQTFAAAFMGLTLECARCHDHKYDPTKTAEYYQLSSYFANIDERGLISYFTDAVPTPAHPMPSQAQELELASHKLAISKAEKNLAATIANSQPEWEAWLKKRKSSRNVAVNDDSLLETNRELMPGLVASLSFESVSTLPEGEYKDEADKKIERDQLRNLINDVSGTAKPWTGAANKLVAGKQGQGMALTGDDAVVLPGIGHYGRHHSFSVSIWIKPGELEDRAVIYRRSRGWDDAGTIGYELTKLGGRLSAKLVHFWPGNAICVETHDLLKKDQWQHVVVTYDGSSRAAGIKIYVDGVDAGKKVVQDHLTRTITQWREGYYELAIGARYRDRGFKHGQVDEFRVFERTLSPIEAQHLADGHALTDLLALIDDEKELTPQQQQSLQQYFIAAHSLNVSAARKKLENARLAWNKTMDAIPALTVMREQANPRPAYVLTRGVYDQHGESVTANTPAFLPGFPADAPRNRLGLAQWLTAPNHPLLARVTVNRYWQMIFGTGLVKTPEDFGLQGESPSHPELLDWLARDFIKNDWDVRRLLRGMVLSATYRQSSVVSANVRDRDPENRLLGRGPWQRLSAEMIRDNALAVSGLLDPTIGGPPVKPYDVALAYTPLPVDKGPNLYRRSLYTFWKRTSPSPVMMTMNASKREVCRLRREVTDSPLQALVLLNGSQFIEASRELGTKLLVKHEDNIPAMATEAFRLLTSREPSQKETDILVALYREQLTNFEDSPKQADELVKVGASTASDKVSTAQIAAATILVNSIMNLDESVRQK